MPYGVPGSKGGDNSLNDLRLERCVSDLMAKNPSWDKSRAVATCKVSMGFTKEPRRGK